MQTISETSTSPESGHETPPWGPATIPHLFQETARTHGGAIAVVDSSGETTYDQLDHRSDRLARQLIARGIHPREPVGVLMRRSTDLIATLLAILKAGGVYVPLDPEYPDSRLRFLIEDAGVRTVLSDADLKDRVHDKSLHAVTLAELADPRSPGSWAVVPFPLEADDGCYVMYTSGSTGRPKGVLVPHRGVVRLVHHADYVDLTPEDVILQLASTSFDASTFEIWGALLNGGRLIVPPSGPVSVDGLRRLIQEHGITTLWLTAGLFHHVMAEDPSSLRGLRQLLAGGDVLSVTHVRRALETLPDCRLINGYGPTENTTFTCCHPIAADDLDGSVPIGRPISGTEVHLVDRAFEPVAAGDVGELVTGGAGLAQGYFGRPARTAASFVPDPFSDQPGARLYRTGDLARRTTSGVLEFMGRVDDQVKVRGFRVELGEVESVLAEHPDVKLAAVVARPDASGDKRLDAYVTPAEPGNLRQDEILEHLRRRLPDWMVPQTLRTLADLPLNANGKVDRRALPEPSGRRPDLETELVAPRNPTERWVEKIFRELLGIEPVGVRDDLFELGGHSLTATRVASRIRAELGVEIPIRELFAEPTVEHLSHIVERAETKAEGAGTSSLSPAPRDRPLPVSAAQRRIWFLSKLDPASLAYNFQSTLRLSGKLHVDALERALTEIVRRHEMLRTTFSTDRGEPVQEVHPPFPISLDPVDLQGDDGASGVEQRLAAAIRDEIGQPFELESLPLVRWKLFRLGEDQHLLLQVEHHLVHDGWSFNVFLGELATLYRAFVAGESPELPPLAAQFADYAAYEQSWLQSAEAERQLEYWKQRLAGAQQALDLPYDHPRPRRSTHRGAVHRIELPASLCNSLRDLAHNQQATLFMVLFSAFSVLLHRYSRQTDLTVGCGVANRHLSEAERLIGMIINTVVLRPDLSRDPTFLELLERVRRITREAYAHQQLPFDRVVEALQPNRNLAENPLFQVAFSFHDAPLTDVELPDLDTEIMVGVSNGSAKFDLNVIGIPLKEQRAAEGGVGRESVEMLWEYSADLFDAETVERMVDHYRRLLEAVVSRPDQSISRIPLLAPDERQRIVETFNRTEASYPEAATIPDVFADHAARAPDALAVIHEGGALTYRDLDSASVQLARHLRARGVGPGDPVAFFLERSPEVIVTELAILRTGGFYVPLDPEFPEDRIRFMLTDCGAPALVLHSEPPSWLAELAEELGVDLVSLEALEPAGPGADLPATPLAADALAYVMYTSGSTGRPKGVAITHRNVISLVLGTDYVAFDAEDVYLAFAPVSFDASTFEVWAPLLTGARVAVPPPGPLSLTELGEAVDRHGITVLWLTSGLFHQMAEERLSDLRPLRHLLSGGDVLSPRWVSRVVEELPRTSMINGYGPTEVTTFATTHAVTTAGTDAPIPIGRPLANHRAYVVDSQLQPTPLGVPGELLLGGAGVARGYWDRPALTAERFVPDPFSGRPGDRLYCTGDLVRWLSHGDLEFLGRIDQQVKIRGFRIEPGEIESLLRDHGTVGEALVVPREDSPGDKKLVAYLTPASADLEPGDLDLADIRRHVEQRLPEFMVPAALVPLESFPLGPTGKVDRRRLPEPSSYGQGPAVSYVAPRTDMEEILAAVWSELTGAPSVGLRDNFFHLGGHSLHAMRHMVRLEELLGITLPLHVLYEVQDLEAMAAAVEAALVAHVQNMTHETSSGDVR